MNFTIANIVLDQDFTSQDEVFKFLSNLAYQQNAVKNSRAYYQALVQREKESTTGFEAGFAIPHGISKKILLPSIFFVRISGTGVEWKAMDDKPAKYIFALAIPQKKVASIHIDLLSKIAVAIMDKDFQEIIIKAQSKEQVYAAINQKIMDK